MPKANQFQISVFHLKKPVNYEAGTLWRHGDFLKYWFLKVTKCIFTYHIDAKVHSFVKQIWAIIFLRCLYIAVEVIKIFATECVGSLSGEYVSPMHLRFGLAV